MIEHNRGDGCRWTYGGQAQPPVRVFSHRIVDPANDLWNIKNQLRDLGGHDVSVVAIRDRDKHICIFNSSATKKIN